MAVAPVLTDQVGGPEQAPGRVVGAGTGRPASPANRGRPDGSTPSVSASSRSAASGNEAAWSPAMRSTCSRAPSSRAWSSAAGVVFSQPPVTARSTTAGLKAANAAVTTRQGAAPRQAERLQK